MQTVPTPRSPYGVIKFTLWLYFGLLLLEGVLRKWIFPEWSDVLFLVRDPVVLIAYLQAFWLGVFPRRPAMIVLWLLVVLSIGFSLASEAPLVVTLFGLRTNYLHLPLVFLMADVLDREDVIRFGRGFMWCSLPIIVLMIVQFNATPEAWINAAAGGTESAQMRGALDRIRPPGPFSFVSGVVSFFGITTAFVLYGWSQRGVYGRPLLILATAAVAMALPISISRSLLLAFIVVVVFAIVINLRDMRRVSRYLGPLAAVAVVFLLAADSVYIQAMRVRWDEAMVAGGGNFYTNVVLRFFSDFTTPFAVAANAPLLGHGIGLGTVAGARLTSGRYEFLLAEGELARIVLELGPALGFAVIAQRWWLATAMVVKSWRAYATDHDSLAWLLTSASFLAVAYGQWGPATSLGFAVFGAGLALAALNESGAVAGAEPPVSGGHGR